MISLPRGLIFSYQNVSNLAFATTMGVRKVSSIGEDLSASRAAKPQSDPALENLRLRRQVIDKLKEANNRKMNVGQNFYLISDIVYCR